MDSKRTKNNDVLFDGYNRRIDTLRISLTDRCTLSCIYCVGKEPRKLYPKADVLTLEEILEISRIFVSLGIRKIKLTGGEPLVRKGVSGLIKEMKQIPGLYDLSLTTNGVLLPKYIDELKNAGLKRINISLDTLQKEKYKIITGSAQFYDVVKGIEMALNKNFSPVKINVVLLNGINSDEILDFIMLTQKKDLIVRFIELMPTSSRLNWNKYFFNGKSVLEKAKQLGEIENQNIFKGFGPAEYYRVKGYKGYFGSIRALSSPFCSQCNRLRLTSTGKLFLCLHNNVSFDLKDLLRNGNEDQIKQMIKYGVLHKPKSHNLNLLCSSKDSVKTYIPMCYMGG